MSEPLSPGPEGGSGPAVGQELPHGYLQVICFLGAAFSLGYAVQQGNGTLWQDAFAWASGAFALTVLGFFAPHHRTVERLAQQAWLPLALIGLAFQFMLLLRFSPGIYLRPTEPTRYILLLAGSALLVGLGLARDARLERWRVPVLLVAYLLLGAWLIQASPRPHIDVHAWHGEAIRALLDGKNPYAITMPDIYGHDRFYGPGLLVDGRVQVGFPYPPLSLLLALPGHLWGGDYRYSLLLAFVVAAGFMAYTRPGGMGAVAAAVWLFMPRSLFVLEQGWTEPFVVALLAATLYFFVQRPRWVFIPLGLLFAVKHYFVLAAPLLWLLPLGETWREKLKVVGRAALVGAVVTLPFFLLDPKAFIADLVGFQLRQPFRTDALSFLAWWAARTGDQLPSSLGFVAALAMAALALWRAPRTAAGFAGSVAVLFFAFFGFSKQAFTNYYFFVIGALCCAVAAASFTGSGTPAAPSRPGGEVPPRL